MRERVCSTNTICRSTVYSQTLKSSPNAFPMLLDKVHYNIHFYNPVTSNRFVAAWIHIRSHMHSRVSVRAVKYERRRANRALIRDFYTQFGYFSLGVRAKNAGEHVPSRVYAVYIRTAPGSSRWRVQPMCKPS